MPPTSGTSQFEHSQAWKSENNPLRKICLYLITICAEVEDRWRRINHVCMNITAFNTESHHVRETLKILEFVNKTSIPTVTKTCARYGHHFHYSAISKFLFLHLRITAFYNLLLLTVTPQWDAIAVTLSSMVLNMSFVRHIMNNNVYSRQSNRSGNDLEKSKRTDLETPILWFHVI
jgi:hypothetical protein